MAGRTIILSGAVLLFGAPSATAQQAAGGQVAASAAGQVGQRQTRGEAVANIEPMARLDSRIQNRIQSRLRTRVDRDYNPEADAVSPFETAADRARTAGRTRRR